LTQYVPKFTILIRKLYGSISGIQVHRLMENVLATMSASLSDLQSPPVSKMICGRMRPSSRRVICSIPWYPVAHQPNCRCMRIACLLTDELLGRLQVDRDAGQNGPGWL
jgi:hypothetical protein